MNGEVWKEFEGDLLAIIRERGYRTAAILPIMEMNQWAKVGEYESSPNVWGSIWALKKDIMKIVQGED